MNVSVVVINYKTPQLLLQCLRSLGMHAPDIDDVIVIDNASHDNSLELVATHFPNVRRIASRVNAGFSKGVNWGITNARNPYVLILNPDIVVSPGSIQHLLRELEQQPDLALIAPQLRSPEGSLQYSCCRFQTPALVVYRRSWLGKTRHGQSRLDHFLMKEYDHALPRDVDWVIGGCMLVRRSAVEQVGLMDERFWLYFEDMDWCRRFWQAGWRIRYDPRVIMVHHHRRQSAKLPGVLGLVSPLGRAHLISGMKYFVKHIGNGSRLKRGKVKAQA